MKEPSQVYLSAVSGPVIPLGYKRTDVGFIPEDWRAASIRDFCNCYSGGTPSTSRPAYYGGHIPWITSSDLNKGRIDDVAGRITDDGLANSAAKMVAPGTLLLALYGATAGVCATTSLKAAINQAVLAIVPQGADIEFLFQFLSFNKDRYIKTYTQGGQPNFSGAVVKSFRVALPSLPEQRAIAAVLSDVDALLGGLDRLIAKKRDLKQAAMQQLLTGQTRLPGFSGDLGLKMLSAVCSMKSGEGITSASIDQCAEFPCYGGNGLRGYTSRFTHDGIFALIGRQGALCGNVYLAEGKFFASEHAIVVTPHVSIEIRWLAAVLGTMNLNQYSESSAQPGLSVSKILMLEILVPETKAEQTAIAQVLTDMDAELAALETRRAKTRELKQAMMQELLTGRTRLVSGVRDEQ